MKSSKFLFTAALAAIALGFTQFSLADHHGAATAKTLTQWAEGEHRSESNRVRNESRNPVETLDFFGLAANMTVIEILPSRGWYTEIMAPYLRDHGKYYAAHFSPNASASYMPPNLRNFEEKITAEPDLYGKITVRHLNAIRTVKHGVVCQRKVCGGPQVL